MKLRMTALAAATLAALPLVAGAPAKAADPVRIGMITTLSGGGSGLGIDIRDGFKLAVDEEGGKLGGVPVELIVDDDARKPDVATELANRMVERDHVQIMTGIVWSNLAIAVVPKVTRAGVFYISPNAGPSLLAGKGCSPNYFNVAWQNDNLHEAMGQYVQDKGFKKVYLIAPNYPAGKDALAGFKRYYKGGVAGEVYTQLGQTDYAAEIAALRDAKPDAVFFFLPGGMGISFIKQYAQAGLNGQIPLFGPAFSFDQGILGAVGEAALGVVNSSQWNKDIDNAANRAFVAGFQKAYGRLPSLYASQGYDAARLIASALKKTGGVADKDAFRKALEAADFDSVRGAFKFASNHHPIQTIYVREVVKEGDVLTNKIIGTAFKEHGDAYAAECKM
ncbi:amino acid/amide ABC transporter substrate-binding protein, HAAT family [Tistlia consotensis]|uniref:Amino acid/amide ABC transporter substrate-binding protein, HAAT family n=1 Tax=Tistlia consotensis USBA 355 TaxID=560819 RepID=A0A1Y6BR94_9PROT|nr:ABC transporter substrate-binding protein [Tistlia consotensis]SMF24082.1 amino acid/amide ABC transporter substrate-binding protein, HAAT family [Tistlia consotensis USBA 355]SNR60957.1 amino acid/amide ABC transporter substrate-binding protein, HAAT family [Tistlia consotensis]